MAGYLDIQHELAGEEVSSYERGLSLDRAVAWTRFEQGGVRYEREYFASQEEQVIVISEKADQKGALDFRVGLTRPERFQTRVENGMLVMEGLLSNGLEGAAAQSANAYKILVKVLNKGGRQRVDGNELVIDSADEAVILVSCGTRLWEEDFSEETEEIMEEAVMVSYPVMKKEHVLAWQEKFGRVLRYT